MNEEMTGKEATFKVINALEILRTVPQFLFKSGIQPFVATTVREKVIEFKKENPTVKEIDCIVESPGGLADEAYRIIRTFRKNFEIVNIIVPYWAKSAATLLSLGGSKIIMDEFGEFGPLDAQVGKERQDGPMYDRESALVDEHSLQRIETRFKEMYEAMYIRIFENEKISIPKTEVSKQLLENLSNFYHPLLMQIDPYKLGEKRRTLEIGETYAKRILAQFGAARDFEASREFVDYLVHGCPDHGYVIDYGLAAAFLRNVYPGNHFGQPYQDKLTELSMCLLREDTGTIFEYIGFVPLQEKVTPENEEIIPPALNNMTNGVDNDVTIDNIASNKKTKHGNEQRN